MGPWIEEVTQTARWKFCKFLPKSPRKLSMEILHGIKEVKFLWICIKTVWIYFCLIWFSPVFWSPVVSRILILTLMTFTLFIFGRHNEAFIYSGIPRTSLSDKNTCEYVNRNSCRTKRSFPKWIHLHWFRCAVRISNSLHASRLSTEHSRECISSIIKWKPFRPGQ